MREAPVSPNRLVQFGQFLANFSPPPHRDVFLVVRVKLELTGFIGVNAALALPQLEINYKDKDKKAEVGLKGEAFAGASGGAGINLYLDWKATAAKAEWANIFKGGVEASFRAGIGGQFDISFGLTDNKRIEFIFKASAVVGLGGKGCVVTEFDFKEGFDLMWYILDSVNYHKAFEASKECFDLFTVAKLVLLINPATGPRTIASRGISLLSEYASQNWTWWYETKPITKALERDYLKGIVSGAATPEALRKCPPETLGMALKMIMQTRKDDDYAAILKILNSTLAEEANATDNREPHHKLRWTVRNLMGEEAAKRDKDAALKDGDKKLRNFFPTKGSDKEQLDKILWRIR